MLLITTVYLVISIYVLKCLIKCNIFIKHMKHLPNSIKVVFKKYILFDIIT